MMVPIKELERLIKTWDDAEDAWQSCYCCSVYTEELKDLIKKHQKNKALEIERAAATGGSQC